MKFLRPIFRGEGVLQAREMRRLRDGTRAKVAGVVLVRQRPGKGNAIFITLEDESGVANILLWARDFEKYRRPVMASRLLEVHGIVQKASKRDNYVVHLVGAHVVDRTAELARLSEDHTPRPRVLRADAFEHPNYYLQGSGGRRHPRNVRIMPPSRDFH